MPISQKGDFHGVCLEQYLSNRPMKITQMLATIEYLRQWCLVFEAVLFNKLMYSEMLLNQFPITVL